MRLALRILLPLLVLTLGFLGSRALIAMKPDPQPVDLVIAVPFVQIAEARSGPQRPTLRSQGVVEPAIESDLVSEVTGRVEWVAPELVSGGFFEAGAPLVRIASEEYRLRVIRARADLARSEVLLAEAEAQAAVAKDDWKTLGSQEVSALALREPQLAEARANVAAAQAALAETELQVARTEIRAPFTGRVREESIDQGSYAMPGQQLARIYALNAFEIQLPLPDDKLAFLDLPAGFAADSDDAGPAVLLWTQYGGEAVEWSARVVRTGGSIDPATRMVQVIARVDDPYGLSYPSTAESGRPPLAVGLFVQAKIQGREYADLVRIPRSALRDSGAVYVVDVEQRLSARAVTPFFTDRDWVWLRGEVQDGERVVTSHLDVFVEGMRVQPAERPAAPGVAQAQETVGNAR